MLLTVLQAVADRNVSVLPALIAKADTMNISNRHADAYTRAVQFKDKVCVMREGLARYL